MLSQMSYGLKTSARGLVTAARRGNVSDDAAIGSRNVRDPRDRPDVGPPTQRAEQFERLAGHVSAMGCISQFCLYLMFTSRLQLRCKRVAWGSTGTPTVCWSRAPGFDSEADCDISERQTKRGAAP